MTMPGTLILINGPTSSGKSSLVGALQSAAPELYLEAGLDKFLWMLPGRYFKQPLWPQILGTQGQAGPAMHTLAHGMHHALAALLRTGNNVLADHVLLEADWLRECEALFSGLPTLFVGALCPVEVLEERERARGDRTLGHARAQLARVHFGARYDVIVDTSQTTPEEGAGAVLTHLVSHGANLAFNSGMYRVG